MREIKFRAWDIDSKRMISPDAFNEWFSYCESSELNFWLNNPESIVALQYTGLKDKNGKEIYEGDIVKASTKNSESKFEVVYSEEWGCWELKNLKLDAEFRYQLGSFTKMNPVVIGNIYENPELLEEKQDD